MSTQKHNQLDKQDKKKDTPTKLSKTKSSSAAILPKISLLISVIAIGLTSYTLFIENQSKKLVKQSYTNLEKQIEKLKLSQQQQHMSQTDIKTIQSQLTYMNNQIQTPLKDIYMSVNLTNLQLAIDYLILAKDVVLSSGYTQKASTLVDIAFDKLQASRFKNIGANDLQDIKEALKNYISEDDIATKLRLIEQQFSKLKYLTAENPKPKTNQPKNKYIELLSFIVKIQDIPKQQTLVSTKQARQFVSDNLYESLALLQKAMYSNNKSLIRQAKQNLSDIIKWYFIQDNNAKKLQLIIKSIKAHNIDKINDSLDKVINQLSEQQHGLLIKNLNSNTA